MKSMTCKQLGGPCDLTFRGNTADEIIHAQDQHLKEAVLAGDSAPDLAGVRSSFVSIQGSCRIHDVQSRVPKIPYRSEQVLIDGQHPRPEPIHVRQSEKTGLGQRGTDHPPRHLSKPPFRNG